MYDAVVVTNMGKRESRLLSSQNVLKVLSKRDLKIIDENRNFKISALISSGKWILCKFDYLRLLIFQNEVAVFNSKFNCNQQAINKFTDILLSRLKEDCEEQIECKQTFPLLVLETCLKHVDDYYDGLVEEIRPEIASLQNDLDNNMNNTGVTKRLTGLQQRFLNLQYRIKDIGELFHDINKWEQDEILEFNISKNTELDQKYLDLIETYGKYFEETMDEIEKMNKMLDFAMRIIDMNILMIRNKMAKFDIGLQIITMSLTGGTFFSSLFGMNLKSHFEDNGYAFYSFVFLIIIFSITIFATTKLILKRHHIST